MITNTGMVELDAGDQILFVAYIVRCRRKFLVGFEDNSLGCTESGSGDLPDRDPLILNITLFFCERCDRLW